MKKRINMIIGKKQIILAGLTLILSVAIYLNYILAADGNDIIANNDLSDAQAGDKSNYGDAQFVSAEVSLPGPSGSKTDDSASSEADNTAAAAASDEYFAQARMDKQKSRESAIETFQAMVGGGDLNVDQLETALVNASDIAGLITSEAKIESSLKALGFEDAICYLDGTNANIIVKTGSLDAAGAAQIKSVLLDEVDVSADNITIIDVR